MLSMIGQQQQQSLVEEEVPKPMGGSDFEEDGRHQTCRWALGIPTIPKPTTTPRSARMLPFSSRTKMAWLCSYVILTVARRANYWNRQVREVGRNSYTL